jgi:MFS family permease
VASRTAQGEFVHTPYSPVRAARTAAWAAWAGSALEYYDFFIYGFVAVLILAPLYFPSDHPGAATLWAVASVGVGYVARAAGAFLLGHWGDVHGRRPVLCFTLLLMGASTLLIAVLPTFADIGIAAPLLLVGLRMLQGLALSAELAGANTLMLEIAPEHRRALYTSVAVSGSQAGFILAALVFLLLSWLLSDAELRAWGWRIAFLLSVVLVAVGLWVRFRLPESAAFLAEASDRQRPRHGPLGTLWRHHKRDVLQVALITQFTVVSGIVAVFSLSWAVGRLRLAMTTMMSVLLASAIVGMLAAPLWARLSDRTGRRPVFIFGTLACAALTGPYLWALASSNILLAFVFSIALAGVAYGAALGVWPALCAEIFKTQVRVSGVAIGTQLGLMLSAQAPTLAAFLTRHETAGWAPVAVLVGASCAVSSAAVFALRETSCMRLADLGRRSAPQAWRQRAR